MKFSIESVARSLAGYLKPMLPGVTFYEDPRQQKTQLPALFLQLISSTVELRRARYLLRTLKFDLTYLDDYNLSDLQRRYQRASELLDLNLEVFPYQQASSNLIQEGAIVIIPPDADLEQIEQEDSIVYLGSSAPVLLRTYNRSADIDLDGLHYKFELRVWLSPEEDAEFMRTLEIILEVRDGE